MSHYDGEGSQSLAVRLMQVAGEYELQQKRERQRLEGRLLDGLERAHAAEDLNKKYEQELEGLKSMVARLKADLEKATATADNRSKGIEQELVATRFQVHERTQQLREISNWVATLDAAAFKPLTLSASELENVDPSRAMPAKGLMSDPDVMFQRCPSVAALGSTWPAVKLHLQQQAARTAKFSKEALLMAAAAGDESRVNAILHPSATSSAERNSSPGVDADVSATVSQAFLLSIGSGNDSLVKTLLAGGASIATRTADGLWQNCLHVAAAKGAESLVKHFIGKPGLDVDCRDAYRRTPLHLAASGNHGGVVKLLLLNGANMQSTDIHGRTASELAKGTEGCVGSVSTKIEKTQHYNSGELSPNPPAPACLRVLEDANVIFWNASVRANRYYAEKRFERAIEAYSIALELAPRGSPPASPRDLATLHYNRARACYRLGQHCAAIEDCSTALRHDPSYRNALAQRAECYMSLFDFERATRDFQGLLDSDPMDRQWERRLYDACGMRDLSYYGILNVRKDADASVIKKAYRSLCLRWHPDKHSNSPEDISRANTAFRRITDAYEALSDSYKRMMYNLDTKANIGTPGMDGRREDPKAVSPVDGFDKWYAKECERDEEREKESAAQTEKELAAECQGEQERQEARAMRLHLINSTAAATSSGSSNRHSLRTTSSPAVLPRIASAIGGAGLGTSTAPSTTSSSAREAGVFMRAATAAADASTSTPSSSLDNKRGQASPPESPRIVRSVSRDSTSSLPPPAPAPTSTLSSQQQAQRGATAPMHAHVSDDDIATHVAATAARARAAVAQAEAFVKLAHTNSQAAMRVAAGSRPGSARTPHATQPASGSDSVSSRASETTPLPSIPSRGGTRAPAAAPDTGGATGSGGSASSAQSDGKEEERSTSSSAAAVPLPSTAHYKLERREDTEATDGGEEGGEGFDAARYAQYLRELGELSSEKGFSSVEELLHELEMQDAHNPSDAAWEVEPENEDDEYDDDGHHTHGHSHVRSGRGGYGEGVGDLHEQELDESDLQHGTDSDDDDGDDVEFTPVGAQYSSYPGRGPSRGVYEEESSRAPGAAIPSLAELEAELIGLTAEATSAAAAARGRHVS